MRKFFPVFLLVPLLFISCKSKLVQWKILEIKYKISGIAEGISTERLLDYGWIWEMESELSRGDGGEYIPGRTLIHMDYYHGKGYRLINGQRVKVPDEVFKRANRKKVRKASDFEGLVKIYKKIGFSVKGEEKYLGRDCLVLTKKFLGKNEVVYLWKELPFNMPLYHYQPRYNGFVEKKAVEIREEK